MKEIKKELTNEEEAIKKEAFLVGYGAGIQEARKALFEIIDEIDDALKSIKEQLNEEKNKDKQDETQKDEEEKGE